MKDKPGADSLLSIDVNGHLQKLADHTHRSPYHYPVELVRTALSRGADHIDIRIQQQRLEMVDNGGGIEEGQIRDLLQLLDPGQPAAVREEAIEALYDRQGIGLLAIFSPSPHTILIENVSSQKKQKMQLLYQKGRTRISEAVGLSGGTRIVLLRKTDGRDQEISILRHYCRGVEKEIVLNGRPLEREAIVKGAMVSIEAGTTDYFKKAEVGIPLKGDICKIWLLGQGIPWSLFSRGSLGGFVFEAAVETDQDVSSQMVTELTGSAARLYNWLCRRYPQYPPLFQKRVEELIFKHHRISGKAQPLNQLFAFRTAAGSMVLNFDQVKTLAGRKTLYAAPQSADLKKYPIQDKFTLALTPKQMDFLVNRKRLPIHFLAPISAEARGFRKWLTLTAETIKSTLRAIRLGKPKPVHLDALSPEEFAFLKALNRYLNENHGPAFLPSLSSKSSIQAVMINARGFFPCQRLDRNSSAILHIRRRHPLIQRAVRAVARESRNIEIVLPLL